MPLLKNAYFHQLINPNLSPNMNNFEWTQLLNPEFYITLSVGGIQIGLYVVLFIVFEVFLEFKSLKINKLSVNNHCLLLFTEFISI